MKNKMAMGLTNPFERHGHAAGWLERCEISADDRHKTGRDKARRLFGLTGSAWA